MLTAAAPAVAIAELMLYELHHRHQSVLARCGGGGNK